MMPLSNITLKTMAFKQNDQEIRGILEKVG
jgi:hypothetical protein